MLLMRCLPLLFSAQGMLLLEIQDTMSLFRFWLGAEEPSTVLIQLVLAMSLANANYQIRTTCTRLSKFSYEHSNPNEPMWQFPSKCTCQLGQIPEAITLLQEENALVNIWDIQDWIYICIMMNAEQECNCKGNPAPCTDHFFRSRSPVISMTFSCNREFIASSSESSYIRDVQGCQT